MSDFLAQSLADDPVVITGMGSISGGAASLEELWAMVLNGQSAYRTLAGERDQSFLTSPVGTELQAKDLPGFHKLDRTAQLLWQAVLEATLQHADQLQPQRTALVVGSSRGSFHKVLEQSKTPRPQPSHATNTIVSSTAGAIAQHLSLLGPVESVSTACTSGLTALIRGAEMLILGHADTVIIGAVDSYLHPAVLAPLQAAGVLGSRQASEHAMRPFSADRNGFVPGEAACALVLTRASKAGSPLARVRSWASANDTAGRAQLHSDGRTLARTMTRTCELAQCNPGEIDALSLHGTATPMNDAVEAAAYQKVFSETGCRPPAIATKPSTGHCLGATSLLEIALSVKCLETQTLPHVFSTEHLDSELSLDLVLGAARSCSLRLMMSNSTAFWGATASVLLEAAS